MITEPFRDLQGADAYDLLGVPPNASAEEIQRAYRVRMKSVHPDAQPGDGTPARLLNVARDVLTGTRPAYDAYRRSFLGSPSPDPSAAEAVDEDVWAGAKPGVPRERHAPPSSASDTVYEVDPNRMTVHRPATGVRRETPPPYRARLGTWPFTMTVVVLLIATVVWGVVTVYTPGARFSASTIAVPRQLAGAWKGEMIYQDQAGGVWIHVTLRHGRRPGRIEYGDDDAKLIAIRTARHQLTLTSDIRQPDGMFTPGKIVASRRPHEKLRLSFRFGTHEVATAYLRRSTVP